MFHWDFILFFPCNFNALFIITSFLDHLTTCFNTVLQTAATLPQAKYHRIRKTAQSNQDLTLRLFEFGVNVWLTELLKRQHIYPYLCLNPNCDFKFKLLTYTTVKQLLKSENSQISKNFMLFRKTRFCYFFLKAISYYRLRGIYIFQLLINN